MTSRQGKVAACWPRASDAELAATLEALIAEGLVEARVRPDGHVGYYAAGAP